MKRNKTNRLLNPFPVFTECLQLVKFFLMMSILSADRFFRAGALKNQLLTGKHFIAVVFRLSHWLAEASNWSFFYMLFLNPKEAKTPPNISETRHNMLRNCCTLLHHLPQFKAREKETERRAVTCHDAKLLLKPSELASSSRASIAAAFTGNKTPSHFQWNQWDTFQDLIFQKPFTQDSTTLLYQRSVSEWHDLLGLTAEYAGDMKNGVGLCSDLSETQIQPTPKGCILEHKRWH